MTLHDRMTLSRRRNALYIATQVIYRFSNCSQQQHSTEIRYYDTVTQNFSPEDANDVSTDIEEKTNGNFQKEIDRHNSENFVEEIENYLKLEKFIEQTECQFYDREETEDKDLETRNLPLEQLENMDNYETNDKGNKIAQHISEACNRENKESMISNATQEFSSQLFLSEESCISDASRELFSLSEVEAKTSDSLHCTPTLCTLDSSNADSEFNLSSNSEVQSCNEIIQSIEKSTENNQADIGQKSPRKTSDSLHCTPTLCTLDSSNADSEFNLSSNSEVQSCNEYNIGNEIIQSIEKSTENNQADIGQKSPRKTSDSLQCIPTLCTLDSSNADSEFNLNSNFEVQSCNEYNIGNEIIQSIEKSSENNQADIKQKSPRKNTSEPLSKYVHSLDYTGHRLSLPSLHLTRAPFFPDVTELGCHMSLDMKCKELMLDTDDESYTAKTNDFITTRKKPMNIIVEECSIQTVEPSLFVNEDCLQLDDKEKCTDDELNVLQSLQENEASECCERTTVQLKDSISYKISSNVTSTTTDQKDDKKGQTNEGTENTKLGSGSEMMETLLCLEDEKMDTEYFSKDPLICRQNILVQSLNLSPVKQTLGPQTNHKRRASFLDLQSQNFNYKVDVQTCEDLKENIPENIAYCQQREIIPQRCLKCSGTHDFISLEQFSELNCQYNAWCKILFPEKTKKYMLRSQTKNSKEFNADSSSNTATISQPKSRTSKPNRRHSDRYFLRQLTLSPNGKTQNNVMPKKIPLTVNKKKAVQSNFEVRKSPLKALTRMNCSRMPPTPPQKKFTHCKERMQFNRTNKFQNVVSSIKQDLIEHPPPPLMQTIHPKKKTIKCSSSSNITACEVINENEENNSSVEKPLEFLPALPPVYVDKPDLSSINDRDWAKLTRVHTIENRKKKTLYFPSLYKPTINRHKGGSKALHWAECLTSDKSLNSSPSHISTTAKPILVKREISCPFSTFEPDEDFNDISIIEQVSVQYSNALSSS